MTQRIRLVLAGLALFSTTAWSQIAPIKGSVVEEGSLSPIPNAVISQSDGPVLTTTDAQGAFTITVKAGTSLKVRALGYTEKTVPAANGMRVVLSSESSELDEVVIVGFGSQKKSNVTGAIAQVKAKDIENMSLLRVEQALQGRTAGVQITQNSGQPGAGSVVRIRGTASINGSDPLYVVDGVIIGGGIDYLNPNDIETI